MKVPQNPTLEVKPMLIKEMPKTNSSSVMLLTGAFIITATLTMIFFFSK